VAPQIRTLTCYYNSLEGTISAWQASGNRGKTSVDSLHGRRLTTYYLSPCGKMHRQCSVHHIFDIDSDNFPGVAKLKCFIPDCHLSPARKQARSMLKLYPRHSALASSLNVHSQEDTWAKYKFSLDSAARFVDCG